MLILRILPFLATYIMCRSRMKSHVFCPDAVELGTMCSDTAGYARWRKKNFKIAFLEKWLQYSVTFRYGFRVYEMYKFIVRCFPLFKIDSLGYMVTLYLIVWRTDKLIFKVVASLYIPTSDVWGSQFLPILPKTCCYLSFWV